MALSLNKTDRKIPFSSNYNHQRQKQVISVSRLRKHHFSNEEKRFYNIDTRSATGWLRPCCWAAWTRRGPASRGSASGGSPRCSCNDGRRIPTSLLRGRQCRGRRRRRGGCLGLDCRLSQTPDLKTRRKITFFGKLDSWVFLFYFYPFELKELNLKFS